jgi:hypothetical protein
LYWFAVHSKNCYPNQCPFAAAAEVLRLCGRGMQQLNSNNNLLKTSTKQMQKEKREAHDVTITNLLMIKIV